VITVPERYRRIERFGCSRSFKAIDFGTNLKRVCDFLLVCHSNLGPILHRFGDIAGVFALRVTPPLFHHNFGVFPLHQIAHVGVSPRIGLKLFGREIIFPTCVITVPERFRQTDGRTDKIDDIL